MSTVYLLSVIALHISTVAPQNSLQNDLQFLKDELGQLKDIADSLKSNITYLEETNKELTRQLHYTNQTFTSKNTAMQNDLVFLRQTNQNLSKSVGNLQQKTNVHRMFTVQNSQGLSYVQHNQVIKFDEITTNEGGSYDIKTGLFTADITGWYVFFFDIRVSHRNHLCWSDLVKNNVRIVLTASLSGDKFRQHLAESNVAVLLLQLGDKVWIRSGPFDGSDCRIDDHSSFSGFLLSAV